MIYLIVGLGALTAWYLYERGQRATRAMPGGKDESRSIAHSETWELYHNDFSLCSKKTRVCLQELGISYKAHHIDLIETGAYENISRHFLKVNPGALVPVLVHEGHPIYESHEQLSYAAQFSDNPQLLIPNDPEAKAFMELWIEKSSLTGDDPMDDMRASAGNAVPGLTLPIFATMIEEIPLHKILEGLLFHRIKKRAFFFLLLKLRGATGLAGMKPVVKLIGRSKLALHQHLDELETALERFPGPWIAGTQFTLADVSLMVIFERLLEVDWLDEFMTPGRARVAAYWQALTERPSYQHAIVEHNHPTVVRGRDRIIELKANNPAFKRVLSGE